MQFLIDDEIYLFQEFKFDETGKMHEFKENKDKSEDARDDYKKDRAILVQQIRYINVYKSLKDKAIGSVFFKLGDYLDTTLNTAKNAKD